MPDGIGPITYKAVAASDRLSDGEEGVIPVLSRRVLVQESLPLPIRSAGHEGLRLRQAPQVRRQQHHPPPEYTVQMVSSRRGTR